MIIGLLLICHNFLTRWGTSLTLSEHLFYIILWSVYDRVTLFPCLFKAFTFTKRERGSVWLSWSNTHFTMQITSWVINLCFKLEQNLPREIVRPLYNYFICLCFTTNFSIFKRPLRNEIVIRFRIFQ